MERGIYKRRFIRREVYTKESVFIRKSRQIETEIRYGRGLHIERSYNKEGSYT